MVSFETQGRLAEPVRRGSGAARRRRRPQAERSAATREKVLVAATACIAEMGYGHATMARIAAQAGVSWGAMQHQFGEKDAIVDAVIERSLADFRRRMSGLHATEPALERRIHAFAERAWENFKGPGYRAVLNVLLQRRDKIGRIATVMTELWEEVFGDLRLPERRQLEARRFAFVMLSGIATESVVAPGFDDSRGLFEVLESTLVRLLTGADATRRRSGPRQRARAAGVGASLRTTRFGT